MALLGIKTGLVVPSAANAMRAGKKLPGRVQGPVVTGTRASEQKRDSQENKS